MAAHQVSNKDASNNDIGVPDTLQPLPKENALGSTCTDPVFVPTSSLKPARLQSRLRIPNTKQQTAKPFQEQRRVSWNITNWDDTEVNLKSSHTSSLRSSQNSLYHILDLEMSSEDGDDDGTDIKGKKRRSLQEVLKEDEEAFLASLASLCLSVENKQGGGGDLTTSTISTLSVSD